MSKSNWRHSCLVSLISNRRIIVTFFQNLFFFFSQWSFLSPPPHTSTRVRQIPAALPAMLPALCARTKVWGFLAHGFGVSDTSQSAANPQRRLCICVCWPQANTLLDSSMLTGVLCYSLLHVSWANWLSRLCCTGFHLCWKSPKRKLDQ